MSVRDEYKKAYSAKQSDVRGRNNKVKKLAKYFCEGRAGNRLYYAYVEEEKGYESSFPRPD